MELDKWIKEGEETLSGVFENVLADFNRRKEFFDIDIIEHISVNCKKERAQTGADTIITINKTWKSERRYYPPLFDLLPYHWIRRRNPYNTKRENRSTRTDRKTDPTRLYRDPQITRGEELPKS